MEIYGKVGARHVGFSRFRSPPVRSRTRRAGVRGRGAAKTEDFSENCWHPRCFRRPDGGSGWRCFRTSGWRCGGCGGTRCSRSRWSVPWPSAWRRRPSIYSVVDGVLLKPLPFPDSRALVRVTADYQAIRVSATSGCRSRSSTTSPGAPACSRRSPASGRSPPISPAPIVPSGSKSCWRAPTTSTCSAPTPALGRTFTPARRVPGIATVAVISDGAVAPRLRRRSAIVGRTLRIDEDVYEIIGVMPADVPPSQRRRSRPTSRCGRRPDGRRRRFRRPATAPASWRRRSPGCAGRHVDRRPRAPGSRRLAPELARRAS